MHRNIEKAKEIQKKVEKYKNQDLPELEIGEICEINDVWDGEGTITGLEEENCTAGDKGSYSYQISDTGEDGVSNDPVWINYEFVVKEVKENFMETVVEITDIRIL